MGMLDFLRNRMPGAAAKAAPPAQVLVPGEQRPSTETGRRSRPEDELRHLYNQMWVDPDYRAVVMDIRDMDRKDGRVKRIHSKIARDCVSGGLLLQTGGQSAVIAREWETFKRRLNLDRAEKLKSDARGIIMEGNLPLQMVLDDALQNVISAVRMPAETIVPVVNRGGVIADAREAYRQVDTISGTILTRFPLWQLFMTRYDPDNFDDWGCYGRPLLDASRTTWRKLTMTEEDLVIRRRMRAPLRMSHVLEGASAEELATYRTSVEGEQGKITTDYYQNKKGAVTAVQGDATLGDIGDVVHLLESFFAGSPLPKGLMGYTDGMARDILEDLKRDYYEDIDLLQATISYAYDWAFRLHLLLKGIHPGDDEFRVMFRLPMTETQNQLADRALKARALGLPFSMVWELMGYEVPYVRERIEEERKNFDPYPQGAEDPTKPRISVTPSNARKNESGTSITNG